MNAMNKINKVLLAVATLILLALWVKQVSNKQVTEDPADRATALSPCGTHQTPKLAEACRMEIERANGKVRGQATVDFANKLAAQ